jgi:hypothetical protein
MLPETGQYGSNHARPSNPSRRSDAEIEFGQITVLHRATGMIAASLAASLNGPHPNRAISIHVSYYCHSWSEPKKWGSICCTLGANQLYQYHRGCRSQPVRYREVLAGKPRYCIEHAANRVYANKSREGRSSLYKAATSVQYTNNRHRLGATLIGTTVMEAIACVRSFELVLAARMVHPTPPVPVPWQCLPPVPCCTNRVCVPSC